ncbi:Protein of unknown function (DUF679 [Striga hermonthica]|uniref:DUF679 domain-containing protein n=1 Tax=Striga hermonthica TaxID=68872 RepID=A0A9N7MX15_STRHE|nr:Protein of unknown function (DUF679 [Striga hermonthica]
MAAPSISTNPPKPDDTSINVPLLGTPPAQETTEPAKPAKTPGQKAVRKAFKGTAHLANLLPTGSVLAFQVVSPVVTNEGRCRSPVSRAATAGLLALCAASCFLLSFTDSFRDERGKVRYGVATLRGIWVVDGGSQPLEVERFRLRFVDVFHAVMSVMVFGSVALFDGNVVGCFWPSPSEETLEVLRAAPVTVGVVCSLLFVMFPTRRHGIGFPLSRR